MRWYRRVLIGRVVALMASSYAYGATDACSGGKPADGFDKELQRLDEALTLQPSASVALTDWCRGHGLMGPEERLAAHRRDGEHAASEEIRRQLHVSDADELGYRHVQLFCGSHLVSDAENWFVPSRLPPAMNEELATTDHPFGLVVLPLHFKRRRLSDFRYGEVYRAKAIQDGSPSDTIVLHVGVLTISDSAPISYVIERYQRSLICPDKGS